MLIKVLLSYPTLSHLFNYHHFAYTMLSSCVSRLMLIHCKEYSLHECSTFDYIRESKYKPLDLQTNVQWYFAAVVQPSICILIVHLLFYFSWRGFSEFIFKCFVFNQNAPKRFLILFFLIILYEFFNMHYENSAKCVRIVWSSFLENLCLKRRYVGIVRWEHTSMTHSLLA